MAEQEQNRSEPASPFKLEEARKQGQVAKSIDVNSVVLLSALLLGLLVGGSTLWNQVAQQFTTLLLTAGSAGLEPARMLHLGSETMAALIRMLAPFLVLAVIAAILANIVQTGPIFSFAPLKPKWERLSPMAGFKRVFNKRMLFEAFKSGLKLVILGWIAFSYLKTRAGSVPGMWSADAKEQATWIAGNVMGLVWRLGAALLVLALLDLIHARGQFRKQMMMSRREMKEEVKRREGDPQVRAKLRELQRENLKQTASLARVPEADVLITNPEHVAIALHYDRRTMTAPKVIAKGCDKWASKMRQLARENGIPIFERRPLARLLLKRGALDAPIPSECFVDVARIYADVDAARRRLVRYEVRA